MWSSVSKPKHDLKMDPKYLERVQKLQEKTHTRVLKQPVLIDTPDGIRLYVVAIGLNGSYTVIIPGIDEKGSSVLGGAGLFFVYHTGKNTSAFDKSDVQKWMTMWIITSVDDDFELVPHRDADMTKMAITALVKLRGIEYFDTGSTTMNIVVQGITQSIPNPYNTLKLKQGAKNAGR